MTNSPLQEKIHNYLAHTGQKIGDLERSAGLKVNVARNILNGRSNHPAGKTLQALASVMGCTVGDLLGAQEVRPQKQPHTIFPTEYPELFKDALHVLLEIAKRNNQALSMKQVFAVLEETYAYSVKKNPPTVDPDFVAWVMEKALRG